MTRYVITLARSQPLMSASGYLVRRAMKLWRANLREQKKIRLAGNQYLYSRFSELRRQVKRRKTLKQLISPFFRAWKTYVAVGPLTPLWTLRLKTTYSTMRDVFMRWRSAHVERLLERRRLAKRVVAAVKLISKRRLLLRKVYLSWWSLMDERISECPELCDRIDAAYDASEHIFEEQRRANERKSLNIQASRLSYMHANMCEAHRRRKAAQEKPEQRDQRKAKKVRASERDSEQCQWLICSKRCRV